MNGGDMQAFMPARYQYESSLTTSFSLGALIIKKNLKAVFDTQNDGT